MRITQKQIAEIVGVSNVAVSNVLHRAHNSRISIEKQEEILRVAQQLGYEPRGVTTRAIGFVVVAGEMHLDATENEIIFAHEILKNYGYRMLFVILDGNDVESVRDALNQKTVDGVLFNCWFDGKIKGLLPDEVPWVLLSEDHDIGDDVDQVSTDTVQVAFNVTQRLIGLGHERICLVAGSAGIGYHERLKVGALRAFQQAEISPENFIAIEVAANDDIAAPLLAEMKSSRPPTAIITASAGKANVVLNRLLGAGYRVPEQVSLVSIGDSYRLTPLAPAISANTIFGRDVIEKSVERLMKKIKSPQTPPERVLLSGEYIKRDSEAPPAVLPRL